MSISVDALRKSELAMIHVAKKALNLEDDAYRSIMQTVTGQTSSSKLTAAGRKALIDHFKKCGFKPVAKKAGRAKPKVGGDRTRYIAKIEAQLAEAKRPWAYADAMAKRICNVEKIDWCKPDDLLKIIAALTYDARRHGRE